MMFIGVLKGDSSRTTCEVWQHGQGTRTAVVHEVAKVILLIKDTYIVQPTANGTTPHRIRSDTKMYPFFKNCIGAYDGTHISAVAPPGKAEAFRNRKGFISQNVLGVVNFDMLFTFVLAGWEGSAHDGRVLGDALLKGLVTFPGKYYLGDAGYSLTPYCLTPYRGIRYHLKDHFRSSNPPLNAKELYNLRHSMLRNVVERTYGVLKKRFRILKDMPNFSYHIQIQLVVCCMILHNFIRIHQSRDDDIDREAENDLTADPDNELDPDMNVAAMDDDARANDIRQELANEMWASYQESLARRRR